MLIPITLSTPSSSNPKLPSGLAKISHDEVVLIELQGSLDIESNHPSDRNGQFVGKLTVDEATNKATLLIGHHLLEGKIQALNKPLAVLVRSKKRSESSGDSQTTMQDEAQGDDCDGDQDEAMVIDNSDKNDPGVAGSSIITIREDGDPDDFVEPSKSESGLDGAGTSWSINAVVKKKIIFSKRPMPITNKVAR